MRGIWVVLLSLAVGMALAGAEFFGSGVMDASGWVWISRAKGKVQWQFYDLANAGQYLSVEILCATRGWLTPPPPSIWLTLHFSTFCSSMDRRVELWRAEERAGVVLYFGQYILARRDLDLGAYLRVEIPGGPSGVEWAVHPASLRIRGASPVYAGSSAMGGAGGMGGPLVLNSPQTLGSGSTATGDVKNPPAWEKSIYECEDMHDAPFLSPGKYTGELGWPGPGELVDAQDWLRVNLNSGHLLCLQVFSPQILHVRLLDPSGKEVGWVSGSGQLGIVYQAPVRGAYWVCISIAQGVPRFTYKLELSLSR